MKERIIVLLFFGLLVAGRPYKTKAQDIYNGDFTHINPQFSQYGPCPVFDDGFLCNWYRSHGTPDWESANNGRLHLRGELLYCLDKQREPEPYGEGIVGGYYFKKDVVYKVEITFDAIGVNEQFSLDVWATANLIEGYIYEQCYPEPNTTDICVSKLNLIHNWDHTPFQKEYIGTTGTISPGTGYVHTFTYTATNDFEQVWIYLNPISGNCDASIDKVKITACSGGYVSYDDNNGNYITPALTQVSEIWAQGPVNTTTNNQAQDTKLIGQKIHLAPNFAATTDPGHFFLAIAVAGCDEEPESPADCPVGLQKRGAYASGIVNTRERKIAVYPNPSTGSFNIEMPQKGVYTIRVMNTLGSTVYESEMTGEQKKSIQLDNNLPPGNYTIHISGDGLRHVERITLIK